MSGTRFGGGPEETWGWHASTLPCLWLFFCPTGCSPCSWSACSWSSAYLWLLQSSTPPIKTLNSSTSCCYIYFLRRPTTTSHMHLEGFSLWSARGCSLLDIPLTPSTKQQGPWHANQLLSAGGGVHERGSLQGLGSGEMACCAPLPPQDPKHPWDRRCPENVPGWGPSLCPCTPVHMVEGATAVLFGHLWGSALFTLRV